MGSRVDEVVSDLTEHGFARFSGALDASIVRRLQDAGARLVDRPSRSWSEATEWYVNAAWCPTYFRDPGEAGNLYDCLGVDRELDAAIEAVIATPAIESLLDRVVGIDRRMWFVQLRWANPGAQEYPLHQDLYGELGLCVYLDDHPDDAGSMVLWPGSHRWPRLLQGFPLSLPAWVAGSWRTVRGGPGDICVFFNKTWHGRTSARERPRLVMLISFIPPGPVEKMRRLPESARAGLGPQLRRVTAPDAARPFGTNPPTDPPLSSRFELEPNCPLTAEAEQAIRDYAWGWSSARLTEQPPTEREALVRLRAFVLEASMSPVVPARAVDVLLDEFHTRSTSLGFTARTHHYLGAAVAAWNGDRAVARENANAWRALAPDALSESPAVERERAIAIAHDLDDDEAVLVAAAPWIGADPPDDVPPTAWSRMLLPLVRRGDPGTAARCHERGSSAIRGQPVFMPEIGLHLQYQALLADPEPALDTLCEHVGLFDLEHNTGAIWNFLVGAWLTVARMADRGRESVERAIPRIGDGPHATRDIAEHFHRRLAGLAAQFDRRNRNGSRTRDLAALGERIRWPAL